MSVKIRVLTIAVVVIIACSITNIFTYHGISWPLSMGHIFLAFVYSEKRLIALFRSPVGWLLLSAVILSSILMNRYLFYFIGTYSTFHFALSEAYANPFYDHGEGFERDPRNVAGSSARGLKCLMYVFLYWFIFRSTLPAIFPFRMLAAATIFSGSGYFWVLYKLKSNGANLCGDDVNASDVLWFAAAGASLIVSRPLVWEWATFYHVVCWQFLPMTKMASGSKAELPRFIVLSVLITALFFILSPAALTLAAGNGGNIYNKAWIIWNSQLVLWTIIHINLSYLTSEANPGWILRNFGARFRPLPLIGENAGA